MATILIYASIKGYKKYQLKRANSSSDQTKSKKNRNSISSLVIPSVKSAYICPSSDDSQLPLYEQKESPKHSVESITAPTRAAPPPVMLGLTLCTSPTTCVSELEGDSPLGYESEPFELPTDETFLEPLSPAPLLVAKRRSSPVPPIDEGVELNYSPDESEGNHYTPRKSSYLEVPELADELLDFEPPPTPPKSPARKLRAASKSAE